MFFTSSGFTSNESINRIKSKEIDFSIFKERISKIKPSSADKRYTEAACTTAAQDTIPSKAGTKCFETTGTCKKSKECTEIAGQIIAAPSLEQLQIMADNHGQLMYTLDFID